MSAERLLTALLHLQTHGRLTGRELADRLEVSEGTVHRDMETLSEAGVPVAQNRRTGGAWELDEEWRSQVPSIDERELRALLMSQMRAAGDTQISAAADRAFAKLLAALPTSLQRRASTIRKRLHVDMTDWRGISENLSMLPVIQDAVWGDRKLAIRYVKADQGRTERVVDPLGLVAKGSTWYLYAGTPDGFRTFRVSRIEKATMLDEPCERSPDFDLAAQWTSSAGQFHDEVSREFEAYARAEAERKEAQRRAAQELEIAKQVQAGLFPQTRPALKTLDYAGVCIQARPVGGDYYDFLDLGKERVGLVIGDIAGKGIAAALLMASLQANLRSQCAVAWDQTQRLLCSVNHVFCENTTHGGYATLLFAEYDDSSRCVRYANCGHLSGLILRADHTVDRLDSTCTVLGLFREWDCEVEEARLHPGDTLALYTDGVTEAFNESEEEFGEQRLVEALRRHCSLAPQDLLSATVEEVRRFSPQEQHDDITMIVARCR